MIALEALLFDKDTKKTLLERDQLHKILEQEAWLFHEEFALAASEERLEDVLQQHIGKLGPRSDDTPVRLEGGKGGRVDLMLQKVTQPRTGEYDYLIVELKRPSQKVNSEVLRQIESYAMAVAMDERFKGVPARWNFLTISNDLDEFAARKANQRNRPKGLVYDDAELNITVWAKSWGEVINDARARLSFVNQQLSYEATRDTAKSYLNKAHARFIPPLAAQLSALRLKYPGAVMATSGICVAECLVAVRRLPDVATANQFEALLQTQFNNPDVMVVAVTAQVLDRAASLRADRLKLAASRGSQMAGADGGKLLLPDAIIAASCLDFTPSAILLTENEADFRYVENEIQKTVAGLVVERIG